MGQLLLASLHIIIIVSRLRDLWMVGIQLVPNFLQRAGHSSARTRTDPASGEGGSRGGGGLTMLPMH